MTTKDRKIDRFRVQVNGFDKSVSQKAVWAEKKAVANGGKSGIIKVGAVELRDNISSINTSTIQNIQHDFSCFPKGDILNEFIKNLKPKKGYYDVGLHGTPTSVCFGTNTPNVSPRLLVQIIRHRNDYHGEDIRLLSCSTGKKIDNEYCFAEELANALGVNVEAPNDLLYLNSKGISKIGFLNQGQMVIYTPN